MTNGNGNRCDNLLATLPLFEIAIVLLRLDYVGSVPVLPLSRNPFYKGKVYAISYEPETPLSEQPVELERVRHGSVQADIV